MSLDSVLQGSDIISLIPTYEHGLMYRVPRARALRLRESRAVPNLGGTASSPTVKHNGKPNGKSSHRRPQRHLMPSCLDNFSHALLLSSLMLPSRASHSPGSHKIEWKNMLSPRTGKAATSTRVGPMTVFSQRPPAPLICKRGCCGRLNLSILSAVCR